MSDLRVQALRARREMRPDARARSSEVICRRVVRSREFQSSKTIACYLPMGDEVDTLLDLARAYIEMGDSDSAGSALKEIVETGNDRQKAEANELLSQINT